MVEIILRWALGNCLVVLAPLGSPVWIMWRTMGMSFCATAATPLIFDSPLWAL